MAGETRGMVTVVSAAKTDLYTINGDINTAGDAVARFLGGASITGKTVRLNHATIAGEALNQPLRDGDTIFVANSDIPNAGFKAAGN